MYREGNLLKSDFLYMAMCHYKLAFLYYKLVSSATHPPHAHAANSENINDHQLFAIDVMLTVEGDWLLDMWSCST